MAKMNPTSLYITTTQILLRSDPNNPSSWQDLYRLAPYLRNSLCCVVCGNLLVDPQTPSHGKCQHHLCAKCRGGKKRIKPTCVVCKDCVAYTENKSLRILLQCYKQMCVKLMNSGIYQQLFEQATRSNVLTGVERGAGNLVMLIREGAAFRDEFQVNGGLSKSVYSILPCIYTNPSTQTLQLAQPDNNSRSGVVLNPNTLYSVLYAGTGNKITIKRKPKEETTTAAAMTTATTTCASGEKPKTTAPKRPTVNRSVLKSRRGCRCGNATPTPGKLTCCGQRCPCYVESKACLECKCRGCRNPHLPDGNKKMPHQTVISSMQISANNPQGKPRSLLRSLGANATMTKTTTLVNTYGSLSNPTCSILMSRGESSDIEEEEITVDV